MKIAIIADLHFGVKKSDLVFQESQLRFFKCQFVPELKEKGIDTIVVCGDVFDTRQTVNVQTENVVINLFKDTFKDFKVHVIVGNHDMFHTTTTEVNSLKCLDLLPNVTVYETPTEIEFGGKSTLMYLLDRLYNLPKENGKITIGGVDILDIEAEYLRENIGIVLQEPYLFSRTLADNIAITQNELKMDNIYHASHTAFLDEAVEKFTKGYDTFVGERGVTLSGGQKQRVAIAQTLMKNAKILIFDDSLSAVDANTDAKIREALNKEMKGTTVFLIAHRITTLMNADNILVMQNGRIKESGTHEILLEKGGIYKKIYDLQTQGMEE